MEERVCGARRTSARACAAVPGGRSGTCRGSPDSATWCARQQMLIGAESPEDLAAAILAAHSQVIPDSLLIASLGIPRRGEAAPQAGGKILVPVEMESRTILLSVRSNRSWKRVAGEWEQEITSRRPSLRALFDDLIAVTRELGSRLQGTIASKVGIEFGCDFAGTPGDLWPLSVKRAQGRCSR